ncbi:hypothetical protein N7532_002821 [Penicillium argentinense]|uniref:Thioesterase domain-containing protein n=1 Tax=Penicillium argentinense TaxID=1131581 RepID=A0A9W9KLK3_9EURO|nr:uncharacterized protein N7532_002821 [Penicillium argentinense]KAJ5110176.1 hypothetical protein N7532_002821 [Penicillium argentinense]
MNSSRIFQLPRLIPSTRVSLLPRTCLRSLGTGTHQNTSAPSMSPWTRRLIYAGIFGLLGISTGISARSYVSLPSIPGSAADLTELESIKRTYEKTLPIVKRLRQHPDYVESDVYEYFSDENKTHRLTSGPLAGSRGLGFQVRWPSSMAASGTVDVFRVFWNDKDKKIVSLVHFGTGSEGWPFMVHGGALGTVIDENLGRAAIRRFPARTGVTANLNVNYRAPVYSGHFYSFHTTLDQERSTDRKAYAKCEVRDMAGDLCVEATGLFVVPKRLQLRTIGETF